MQSMIKALGLQEKVQLVSMFNIFFVGLPAAYIFAIPLGYGINGLWFGEIIGFTFNLISYSYLVFTSNWYEISSKC